MTDDITTEELQWLIEHGHGKWRINGKEVSPEEGRAAFGRIRELEKEVAQLRAILDGGAYL